MVIVNEVHLLSLRFVNPDVAFMLSVSEKHNTPEPRVFFNILI